MYTNLLTIKIDEKKMIFNNDLFFTVHINRNRSAHKTFQVGRPVSL